jgi:hypothetical protein
VAVGVRVELQPQAVLLRDDLAQLVRGPDHRLPLLVVELGGLEERAGGVVAVAGHRHEDHVPPADRGGELGHLAGDRDDVRPVTGPVQAAEPVHGAAGHGQAAPAELVGQPRLVARQIAERA